VSAVFVTGTDTGCGKTAVASALARTLRAAGQRVRVLKPIETGCENGVPADARALAAAAGDDAVLERLCPYRLALPAAPEIAARAEGVALELGPIEAALATARAGADLVIVEGAGGLLVPITPTLDMAGLAAHLRLPVLIVARSTLGTINHTLLTLESARARELRVLGVVVSHATPALSDADRRNLDLLIEHLPVPLLAELRFGEALLPAPFDPAAFLASVGHF
jgi:dethiobiotin synthetase